MGEADPRVGCEGLHHRGRAWLSGTQPSGHEHRMGAESCEPPTASGKGLKALLVQGLVVDAKQSASTRANAARTITVMIVQIYGLTTPGDVELVSQCRPDHAGIVLDEGYETWDSVDADTAAAICSALDDGIRVVALSLAVDLDRITETVTALEPDIVHLARATDGMSPEDLDALRQKIAPVEIVTTVPVRDRGAVQVAKRFAEGSDWLLLDTVHPETGVVGATGYVHDWAVSAEIVQAVDVPVVLAGGLGPENVADAIRRVRPRGVDSETRTSREDDRRRKDPAKVREFVELARVWGGRTPGGMTRPPVPPEGG